MYLNNTTQNAQRASLSNVSLTGNDNHSHIKLNFETHEGTHNKDKFPAQNWKRKEGTVEDLAEQVKQGKAFMTGLLNESRHRAKSNVVAYQSIAVDIDSETSLQEALDHPFTKKYCGLIYTSHTHQKDKFIPPTKKYPEGYTIAASDRYRLVFVLPQPLEDFDLFHHLWEEINTKYAGYDPECKDESRLFYGNTEAEIILCDPTKVLDEDVIADAKDRQSVAKAQSIAKEMEKAVKSQHYDYDPQKTKELAEKALSYIPQREFGSGNYHECLQVLMALESEFGKDEAIRMAENWSPSKEDKQNNKNWDVAYKINNFQRSGISVGTLFYIAEKYGFEMPKNKSTGKGVKSKNNLQENQWDFSKVDKELNSLLDQKLEDSQIEIKLGELATNSGWNYNSLKSSLDKLRLEKIYEENREETQVTLDDILSNRNANVDVFEVLPEGLAQPISKFAKLMGVKPIVMATGLLCGISGLNDPDTKLMLYEPTNFKVSPNLFGSMVGESSQKKSPVLGNMIENPLKSIQKEMAEQFEQEMDDYKKQYANWKKEGKENGEPEPEKPKQKVVYFTNPTPEGIANQANNFPNQGLMYVKDELAGIFKSFNKYSNGAGDEQEVLLSLYDGRGGVNLRADGIRADFSNTLLSLFGTIQPEVLRDMMGSFDDSNGLWARIILVNQPLSASYISKSKSKFDLEPMIESIYRTIYESQKPRLYCLSDGAEDVFIDYYNWCEKLRTDKTKKPALRSMYGKSEGRAGKIALNLHKLYCAFTGKEDDGVISEEIMKIAIKLNLFYIKQILVIHEMLDDDDESQLTGILSRIVEIAENKGIGKPVKPREIRDGLTKRERKSSEEIKTLFYELEKLGYGEVTKEGRTVAFVLKTLSPSGDKSGAEATPAETPTTQGFQTSGDNWGQSGAEVTPAGIPTTQGFGEKWGQNSQNTPSSKNNSTHSDGETPGDNSENNISTPPHSPHCPQKCQNSDSEGNPAGVGLSPDNPQITPAKSPEAQNAHTEGNPAGADNNPISEWEVDEPPKANPGEPKILKKYVSRVKFPWNADKEDPANWHNLLEVRGNCLKLQNKVSNRIFWASIDFCQVYAKRSQQLKVGDKIYSGEKKGYFTVTEILEGDKIKASFLHRETEDVLTAWKCVKAHWQQGYVDCWLDPSKQDDF